MMFLKQLDTDLFAVNFGEYIVSLEDDYAYIYHYNPDLEWMCVRRDNRDAKSLNRCLYAVNGFESRQLFGPKRSALMIEALQKLRMSDDKPRCLTEVGHNALLCHAQVSITFLQTLCEEV